MQDLSRPYQYDPSLSMRDNQEAAEQHALERRVAQRDARRAEREAMRGDTENRETRWPRDDNGSVEPHTQ